MAHLSGWIAASLVLPVSALVVVLAFGPPPIVMGPWDHFLLLDEAWRIQQGSIPHANFYNPIGSLTYLLVAAGLAIGGDGLTAITYGTVIFWLFVMPATVFIAFSRLPSWLACIISAFLGVMSVAMRPLGFDSFETSYAMLYNRFGWIMFFIVILQFLVPMKGQSRVAVAADSVIAGLLLGCLFYCKISYFVVAVGVFFAGCALQQDFRSKRIGSVIISFGAVVLLFQLMKWSDLPSYLGDVGMAAAAQDRANRFTFIRTMLFGSKLTIAAFATAVGFISIAAYISGVRWTVYARILLIAGSIYFAGAFLSAGNAGEQSLRDFPLLFFGVVILTLMVLPCAAGGGNGAKAWIYAAMAVGIGFFLFPTFRTDAQSLVEVARWRKQDLVGGGASIRFDAKRLTNFMIRSDIPWKSVFTYSDQVPSWVASGIALLEGKVNQDSRLAVLSYSDPFTYALNLKPSNGMPVWLVPGYSFSVASHPKPAVVLGGADFVLTPLLYASDSGCCRHFMDGIIQVYGPALHRDFTEIARNDRWVLFGRNLSR